MNNFVQNYKIILKEWTKTCSHIESFLHVKQSKLSNLALVALNLMVEYAYYFIEIQLIEI
jgi:hypothetical protein